MANSKRAQPAAAQSNQPSQSNRADSGRLVTPPGEDLEPLDPAEEALLQGREPHERQEREAPKRSDYAPGQEGADPESGNEPESDPESEPGDEGQAESQAESGAERESAGESETQERAGERKPRKTEMVPAWSLVKERGENRELKRKLEELTQRLSEHESRWTKLNERMRQASAQQAQMAAQQAQQRSDPEPDPKADPAAHVQWELRRYRDSMEALARQNQLSTVENRMLNHRNQVLALEQEFRQSGHDDYYERVNFIRERRERELELMGYRDPSERATMLANETAMLVAGAMREGRNPAEVAYRLAEQWGYRRPGAESASAGAGANEKLAELARKQAATQSLQAIPSRAAQGPVTLEDIAEMDDEAYERYVDKHGGDLALVLRGR